MVYSAFVFRLMIALAVVLTACRSKRCIELDDPCECLKRRDCALETEPCWCASACDPTVSCVCGGGRFLFCRAR